jgi:hypothetical protein
VEHGRACHLSSAWTDLEVVKTFSSISL